MTTAADLVAEVAAAGWRVVLSGDGPYLTRRRPDAPALPPGLVDRLKADREAVVVWLRAGGRHCGKCGRAVDAGVAPLLAGLSWGVYCGEPACPERDRHQPEG